MQALTILTILIHFDPFCIYPKWTGHEVCETASRNACRSTGPPALPWHDGRVGHTGMGVIYFHIFSYHFCPVYVQFLFAVVFLSSVPRSLRSKASGLEKARQISWRVFYLRQSFVNLSRKEHGAVTRPHLWNLMDTSGLPKRTHKTVLFQNVLSSQPDRVKQGVVIEIPSTAVLPTDVLCAQLMTNESNELLNGSSPRVHPESKSWGFQRSQEVGRARLTRMLQVTCKARTNCLRIMGQSWWSIIKTHYRHLWTVEKLHSGTHYYYVTLPNIA